MDRHGAGLVVGRLVLSAGRRLKPLVPVHTRRWLDDRLFSAIFQATRVTNDNYGYGIQGEQADTGQSG